MAPTITQLVKRHGALVSGVTAVAVWGAVLLQQILNGLVGFLAALPYLDGQSYLTPNAIPHMFVTSIPFALGFFVSLWIVAPIAEQLRVPHVITRAVLATGIGATLVFVVRAVLGIVAAFSGGGPWFGNSMVWPSFDGGYAVSGIANAFSGSILFFLAVLPLGILAGVLLWVWRKEHPPKRPLSGLIDEV